jgi:hypothetical protein
MRNSSDIKGGSRVPQRSGEAGLVSVPRLEDVAADPSRAWVLDADTTRTLAAYGLRQTATGLAATVALMCRLLDPASDGRGSNGVSTARGDVSDILTVEEAAKFLGKDVKWLKRARLPFVKRISRKNSICLKSEMMRWLASRPNAKGG